MPKHKSTFLFPSIWASRSHCSNYFNFLYNLPSTMSRQIFFSLSTHILMLPASHFMSAFFLLPMISVALFETLIYFSSIFTVMSNVLCRLVGEGFPISILRIFISESSSKNSHPSRLVWVLLQPINVPNLLFKSLI